MLTVTRNAIEKFIETLENGTFDTKIAIRIIRSTSTPNRLALAFDKKRKRDQVLKTVDGVDLLLIGPDVAPELEDAVIDYQTTSQSTGFILSKPVPNI